jgi:hypothetical protein
MLMNLARLEPKNDSLAFHPSLPPRHWMPWV